MKSKPLLNYKNIEKKIGVRFKNKSLLIVALTHSSYAQGKNIKSNETIEFLGDAVLELIVREYLLKKFPKKYEGELNQLKKSYTSEEALYKIGKKFGIGNYLLMDKGEELTGGRERPSNISCGLEAIIGAVYLDKGLKFTKRFVSRIILYKRLSSIKDYKSLLNQWAMQNQKGLCYKVIKEEGPPHNKTFYIGLYINGKKVAEGIGSNKKKAEQEASKNFLAQRKICNRD